MFEENTHPCKLNSLAYIFEPPSQITPISIRPTKVSPGKQFKLTHELISIIRLIWLLIRVLLLLNWSSGDHVIHNPDASHTLGHVRVHYVVEVLCPLCNQSGNVHGILRALSRSSYLLVLLPQAPEERPHEAMLQNAHRISKM